MAKATITANDSEGDLKFTIEYDPPLKKGQRSLSPAQAFVFEFCKLLSNEVSNGAGDALDKWADTEDE